MVKARSVSAVLALYCLAAPLLLASCADKKVLGEGDVENNVSEDNVSGLGDGANSELGGTNGDFPFAHKPDIDALAEVGTPDAEVSKHTSLSSGAKSLLSKLKTKLGSGMNQLKSKLASFGESSKESQSSNEQQ